ncbi:hypothetical protein [Prosthecobacter sp.]|uniref:hypothetical protein n=1 Tax=Prosthecobacter sp. TaxID=1965333 RepID=UPI00248A5B05|nr:hypothetical protein [Prosthecobacter sp.]MDI1310699.1 hypothetical protein [Prosthecobacter sp.]
MTTDPIAAEVRANREAIFAECGYDLDRFNAHTREVEEQLKREGWIFADRPIVRTKPQESFFVREAPPASTEP